MPRVRARFWSAVVVLATSPFFVLVPFLGRRWEP